jgi:uncharacterized lipoprotein NlpE involved in copper resistance
MKVFYSFVLFCITCLCSCKQNAANDVNTDSVATMKMATDTNNIITSVDTTHNANNSLDWAGTYKGRVPVDDHGGLITLQIMLHPDGTYMLGVTNENYKPAYPGDKTNEVKLEGKFAWKDGSDIELDTKSAPSKYRVEENKLIELDRSGKKITGADADKYILTKQ